MMQSKSVQVTLPFNTYQRLLDLAENMGAVSASGNPKAATAMWQITRMVLEFHKDEKFQDAVKQNGGDTLGFIKKCVRREIQKKS